MSEMPTSASPTSASPRSATQTNSHLLERAFLAHPRAVDETYWQHFAVAGGFGVQLMKASLAAFAHALVPAACERTASDTIKTLHVRMAARH